MLDVQPQEKKVFKKRILNSSTCINDAFHNSKSVANYEAFFTGIFRQALTSYF